MINQISWGTTYSHSISRCTLHSIRNPPRLVDLFRLQIPSDTPNTWELCPKMGNPQKPEILLDCWTRFFFFLSGPVANSKNMFFLMISKNRKSSFSGVWKTKNNYFWMIWKDVFVFFSYAASAKQISLKNTIFFESNNIENHEITSFFAIWKRILFFGFCKRNKLIFWSFEHAKQWFFKILKNAKHCFCFFFSLFEPQNMGFSFIYHSNAIHYS